MKGFMPQRNNVRELNEIGVLQKVGGQGNEEAEFTDVFILRIFTGM
jgi:hypothetical protein